MKFTKMQGCGNDYVYVNGFEEKIEDEVKTAIKVSDRHFGIGGDGMIIINPSNIAYFEMKMYNADGTRAEMCGNGIRCVAKYVFDLTLNDDGKVKSVKVDMGAPVLDAKNVPVISKIERAIGDEIEVDGKTYIMTCVLMGNPHAVIFLDEDIKSLSIDEIGSKFENHERFPNRTNTEFARIIDRQNIEMRVWERGTGETLACGTGCCATAVAGILDGRVDNNVKIHVLGGVIDIYWSGKAEDSVIMSGPAQIVFDGEIKI